jgi:hypothetical protein
MQRYTITLNIALKGFLPFEAAGNDTPYGPIQNFHPFGLHSKIKFISGKLVL